MMFFDRAMLAMGNILFLLGLLILIGPQKTLLFFARRQKLKGTAAFTAGIILILIRWPFFGFIIEVSYLSSFPKDLDSQRKIWERDSFVRRYWKIYADDIAIAVRNLRSFRRLPRHHLRLRTQHTHHRSLHRSHGRQLRHEHDARKRTTCLSSSCYKPQTTTS